MMNFAQIQIAKRTLGLPNGGSGPARKNWIKPTEEDEPHVINMVSQGWMQARSTPVGESGQKYMLTAHGIDQFKLQYGEFRFLQKSV